LCAKYKQCIYNTLQKIYKTFKKHLQDICNALHNIYKQLITYLYQTLSLHNTNLNVLIKISCVLVLKSFVIKNIIINVHKPTNK